MAGGAERGGGWLEKTFFLPFGAKLRLAASTGAVENSSDIQNTEPGAPEQPSYWLWKIPQTTSGLLVACRKTGRGKLPPTHPPEKTAAPSHETAPPPVLFLLNNQKPNKKNKAQSE